jgi:thymidylate kinase
MTELIALCGIDGTGKSTQALLLQKRLRISGRASKVLWCRWDPVLARPAVVLLDRLSRRAETETEITSSSGESGDRRRALKRRLLSSRLIRKLWTSLMVIDYGLQVAPRLMLARRTAEVVIVDRYRHDVLIDLSAGGELVSTPLVLRWLLPEPDIIVILDVDAEIALSRKPDSLDLRYLKERRHLYRQLSERSAAVLVDAGEPTDVVSDAVFRAIATSSKPTDA